jgi:hypothetical protein
MYERFNRIISQMAGVYHPSFPSHLHWTGVNICTSAEIERAAKALEANVHLRTVRFPSDSNSMILNEG